MFKPARFCKLAKMTIITLEYVSPKTNTQTECLVGLLQGLPCSIGEIPVSSNKVESLTEIVYVQVKISKSAILFGKSTGSSIGDRTHAVSHQSYQDHMRGRQLISRASYGVEKIGSRARQYGAGNDKCSYS